MSAGTPACSACSGRSGRGEHPDAPSGFGAGRGDATTLVGPHEGVVVGTEWRVRWTCRRSYVRLAHPERPMGLSYGSQPGGVWEPVAFGPGWTDLGRLVAHGSHDLRRVGHEEVHARLALRLRPDIAALLEAYDRAADIGRANLALQIVLADGPVRAPSAERIRRVIEMAAPSDGVVPDGGMTEGLQVLP